MVPSIPFSGRARRHTAVNRTGTRYPEGRVPLVEFTTSTPLNGPNAGKTTGTVNPSVSWVNRSLRVGVEANIPMNAQFGRDVGVRAQAHLYLPAIFPDFYGKRIFSK